MRYIGLDEFGVRLIGSDDPRFAGLLDQILDGMKNLPGPLQSWRTADPSHTAVLLNESGKAIVTLSFVWRFADATGATRTSRYTNLGSSAHMDVLTGRTGVCRDIGTFVLPGSKRAITPAGMFGTNLDVLPELAPRGGGYAMGGGSRAGSEDGFSPAGLTLDFVLFEDGLCAGPDETGLFDRLKRDLERQNEAARQAWDALRAGSGAGAAFEILRPSARRSRFAPLHESSPVLAMFAHMAIQQLVDLDGEELADWFRSAAEAKPLALHRQL